MRKIKKKEKSKNNKKITNSTNNKTNNIKTKKENFLTKLNKLIGEQHINSKKAKNKNRTRKNNKEVKSKKSRKLWKKIITIILILCIICILAFAAFFAIVAITAPKFDPEAFNTQEQTVIYDINGNEIAKLGTEKRENISYEDLPQVLIDAIVATEDSRFFEHNGVDLPRFIKATVLQLLGQNEAGGASTLTMQIVKNNLTKKNKIETNPIKKIIRKFQDVYLAVFKVEKKYSKESIMEFYVNDSFLGRSGVEETSKYFFNKSASDLTLPEAALIAGLFQSPGLDNPYKNIDNAEKRRDTVLYLMTRHGYITKEEAKFAKSISIESLLANNNVADGKYQGYIDTVVDEVEEKTGKNPYTIPMKIYTTMEPSIQNGIDNILNGKDFTWENDVVQAGIAIVNVETGAISAVGAGRNRVGERSFNFATQARRQPGSTAKPLFDYGPAMEYNNYSTYQLFNDEPWAYTNGPSVGNWDGGYGGLMTLRYAVQYSRNVPALKTFQEVGPKNIIKFVNSLGLDIALNSSSENYKLNANGSDNAINEAYSIGGTALGFTPLEMASAYSGFASGGYYTEPYTVTKIEYRNTDEVWEYKPKRERVMSDSTAYLMNNVLESAVTGGFNGGALVWGSHVAAKTGTSNFSDETLKKYNLPSYAVNDIWTVAYTTKYSIALWYGYKEISSEYYLTNNVQKEAVMRKIMTNIPKDTVGFTMPSSVVASQVEMYTYPAKLPSENTPSDLIKTEYFKKGTHPTEVSERFATINDVKNVKTTIVNNNITLSWDFETPNVLTDEYLRTYFSQSVFGKQTDKYINERKSYNKNSLGPIIFAIYKIENDGSETLVGTTKENTFKYTGAGSSLLIIRAEHKYFKANASKGIKVSANLGNEPVGDLKIYLAGKLITNTQKGKYTEPGFVVYYNGDDITKKANITYQISDQTAILPVINTIQKLESAINQLDAGKYKINYIADYIGLTATKTRTVIISDDLSTNENRS